MKKLFTILIILILSQPIFCQIYKGNEAEKHVKGAKIVRFKEHSKVPVYILFNENSKPEIKDALSYSNQFIKRPDSGFQLKNIQKNSDQTTTYRYYQTINNIPVEFTTWSIHENNGKVYSINGEIFDNPETSVIFSISEENALNAALKHINAEKYMWQNENQENLLKEFKNDETATYYPKGEKVIVPDKINLSGSELKPAYKFNIYSLKPYDRKMVYVDAQTGNVLFDLQLIQDSDEIGTGHTQYSGIQQINTEYDGVNYILKDNTRGNGIRTLNCENTMYYDYASEFTDEDNIWNNVNQNLDEYATDAHFATIKTYDYFLDKHNRNSIDGYGYQLWSYVHFSLIDYGYSSNVNAFWNGEWMTYGDGSVEREITPLTTVDICGHEITHGLTTNTADLLYWGESGALNEAFSDIFGTSIEFYAVPELANWTIGEKIGYIMRSMENPKAYQQPNTYKGEYWEFTNYDNGGVHINSGVLNYWFYLVSEGGSGTNDLGNSYTVTGIGINKAEKIAFKVLTQYLSELSDYNDAYFYGIQAATEIFGDCSPEVEAVFNAFFAVGLTTEQYTNEVYAEFRTIFNESCQAPFTVKFFNESYNGNSFLWDFGDGTTSTETNPEHTYLNEGNYNVKLIVTSNTCGSNFIEKENYIKIDPGLPCHILMQFNEETLYENCKGIIFDDGGPEDNYSANFWGAVTLHSPEASFFVLKIMEFDVPEDVYYEECEDFLAFYDGRNIYSPLINNSYYCNINKPPEIIVSSGNYITLQLVSYYSGGGKGFKIEYECIGNNTTALPLFSTDKTRSCDGYVKFTDKSLGNITSRLWDFGDGNTSTEQNPIHKYNSNGVYSVKLTVINQNGERELLKEEYINVDILEIPEFNNVITCKDSYTNINLGLSSKAYWYSNTSDNTPIHIGSSWNHPPIDENKTYYIKLANETNLNVGPAIDQQNGSIYNQTGTHVYLKFDAFRPFKLKSVLVNASESNYRIITLRTSIDNIIFQKYVYIESGTSSINLNIDVPAGEGYELISSIVHDLFMSDNNVNYPYTIEGIVSITGSSEGPTKYPFFYNWEIEIEECNSDFSEINLIYSDCVNVEQTYALNSVKITPNPGFGIFEIYGLEGIKEYNISITDISGKVIMSASKIKNNTIDLTNYAEGIYYVKINNSKDQKIIKLVNQK